MAIVSSNRVEWPRTWALSRLRDHAYTPNSEAELPMSRAPGCVKSRGHLGVPRKRRFSTPAMLTSSRSGNIYFYPDPLERFRCGLPLNSYDWPPFYGSARTDTWATLFTSWYSERGPLGCPQRLDGRHVCSSGIIHMKPGCLPAPSATT